MRILLLLLPLLACVLSSDDKAAAPLDRSLVMLSVLPEINLTESNSLSAPTPSEVEADINPNDCMLQDLKFHHKNSKYYVCLDEKCVKKVEKLGLNETSMRVIGRSIAPSSVEFVKRMCPNGFQHLRHLGFNKVGDNYEQNLNGEGIDLGWVSVVRGACGADRKFGRIKTMKNATAPWFYQGGEFYFWQPKAKPSTETPARTEQTETTITVSTPTVTRTKRAPIEETSTTQKPTTIQTTTPKPTTTATTKKPNCQIPPEVETTHPHPWTKRSGDLTQFERDGYKWIKCNKIFIGQKSADSEAFSFGGEFRCNDEHPKWTRLGDDYEGPQFMSCGYADNLFHNITFCNINDQQWKGNIGMIALYPGHERICPIDHTLRFGDGTLVESIKCTGREKIEVVGPNGVVSNPTYHTLKCIPLAGLI